jgi:cardiolipin synthase A/B
MKNQISEVRDIRASEAEGGLPSTPPVKPRRRLRRRGIPGLWARFRSFLWSWWPWAAGAVAALLLDRSYMALSLAAAAVAVYLFAPRESSPTYGLEHDFAIESEEFLNTMVGATGTPFLPGNDLEIYNNGDEFYPVMLAEVERASASVTIEAYIYWEGDIGRRFARAFAAKAAAGLPVKILLDAVGSSTIGKDILAILKESGCEVEWYHPLSWYNLNRVNNRTHRKSLIIDGRVGFTGGAGIADHWMGCAADDRHWRDIQVRLRGPAVVTLQTGFARNWLETTGELVSGPTFYPAPEAAGDLSVQSILSSPETGSSTVRVMYYLSIVCARRSILIANPYFIPDQTAIDILVEARRRGVDVKVMVTGIHNDVPLARLNSIRLYGRLLEEGVEIYEYNRTMMHHKYMVCDGIWTTIGTTNFDNRALALNEENNLCLYDAGIAARFERIFADDLAACQKVELADWRRRGFTSKAIEQLASLLKEQI